MNELGKIARIFGQLCQGAANQFAGSFALVGGTKTITFPTAYNVTPIVILTEVGAPGILGTTALYIASSSTTGFTATSTSTADTRTINWVAIGNPN